MEKNLDHGAGKRMSRMYFHSVFKNISIINNFRPIYCWKFGAYGGGNLLVVWWKYSTEVYFGVARKRLGVYSSIIRFRSQTAEMWPLGYGLVSFCVSTHGTLLAAKLFPLHFFLFSWSSICFFYDLPLLYLLRCMRIDTRVR